MINHQDQVHCSLVMAKSRVAPLKPVTVPRLELVAAVVATNISAFLQKELKYNSLPEVFWTDSKVVLGYISNDARRFHTFVANRVQLIRDQTSPDQWNYVETKENPADDASRGLTAQEKIDSTRWWSEPEFLWKPLVTKAKVDVPLSLEDPEVRKITVMSSKSSERPVLLQRIEYFSDWHRAKRAIAFCLLFIQRMKESRRIHKEGKDERLSPEEKNRRGALVNVEDLQRAERMIIKAVQSEEFRDEIEQLKKIQCNKDEKRNVREVTKKTSAIHRLNPVLGQHGILRVGGRIDEADLPYYIRHPIILPKKSHVTELIFRHLHQRVHHQDRARTHAEIRTSCFWIINGSSTVGHHVSKCVTCKKLRGTPEQQKMSDLPPDRLEQAPPFTYSAVDYFGPWYKKEGRKEMKRYGVLFTCMASRAVHLETAASLTTDSFLNAYRRFINRRGPVRQLRSDQGTNFVGAKNELEAALMEMNHDTIQRELLITNCDWINWKMNVPHASHMGGSWERQIRTVRSVLSALLQNHGKQLDNESLSTLMTEAEAIVNSRPLAIDDLTASDAVDVLTPNRLLTMKSAVVLAPP
ncbi:uncharacterized protein LOC144637505 [Oculina patagonica]